jgi:hypothetical protein
MEILRCGKNEIEILIRMLLLSRARRGTAVFQGPQSQLGHLMTAFSPTSIRSPVDVSLKHVERNRKFREIMQGINGLEAIHPFQSLRSFLLYGLGCEHPSLVDELPSLEQEFEHKSNFEAFQHLKSGTGAVSCLDCVERLNSNLRKSYAHGGIFDATPITPTCVLSERRGYSGTSADFQAAFSLKVTASGLGSEGDYRLNRNDFLIDHSLIPSWNIILDVSIELATETRLSASSITFLRKLREWPRPSRVSEPRVFLTVRTKEKTVGYDARLSEAGIRERRMRHRAEDDRGLSLAKSEDIIRTFHTSIQKAWSPKIIDSYSQLRSNTWIRDHLIPEKGRWPTNFVLISTSPNHMNRELLTEWSLRLFRGSLHRTSSSTSIDTGIVELRFDLDDRHFWR